MSIKNWDDFPEFLRKDAVAPYYALLRQKKGALFAKRGFDILLALVLLLALSPIILLLSMAIKLDSQGSVFFRQLRVTQYGRRFRIFKFRTMQMNAEKAGSAVTVKGDTRITRTGQIIRKFRLDEIPQLFNILWGDMSFVGTRPEVPRYVEVYSEEMLATLLMPAGLTSLASIEFREESELLDGVEDVDQVYEQIILPQKMRYNLEYLRNFSFLGDLCLLGRTALAVLR